MKQKLLFCFSICFALWFQAFAQEAEVTGKVTDATTGESLPGVSVIVDGTSRGTVTDLDGNYSISVSQGATLVFQSIGMVTQKITVGSQTTVNVSLQASTEALNEVVVTAIGLETEKKALGYSIQSVKGEDLVQAQETNLVNALNSKVAGVNIVSSSGSPGASASIRIRGNTSINSNNSPLFVVDGVPISNNEVGEGVAGIDQSNRVIDLNPGDIASLTVLKGPAATALYGSRASSGAIIITTKRGQLGRATSSISFRTSFTADQVNKLPDMQTSFAQGRPSGGEFIWRGPETGEGFSWGPAVSSLEYDGDASHIYDVRGRLVPVGDGNGSPAQAVNNTENFFTTGTTWDNNLSFRGGTKDIGYYVSFGHLRQTGIVPKSKFERTSVRANVDAQINEKLKIGASVNYVNSGGTRAQRGSNLRGTMLGLLRTTPTFDNGLGLTGKDAANNPDSYVFPDGSQRSYRAGIYDNPYWVSNRNVDDDDVNRIIGNLSLNYKVAKWFDIVYKVGVDNFADIRRGGIDIVRSGSTIRNPGSAFTRSFTSTFINSDILGLFNYSFGEEVQLSATVGHNYFTTRTFDQLNTGDELGIPNLFDLGNVASEDAFSNRTQSALHGVFADIRIGWRNMVFLNVSGRNDFSSTLPTDDNSFFYPAASLAFTISELIPENNVVSYAKARASWGQVGNSPNQFGTTAVFIPFTGGGDGFTTEPSGAQQGITAFERGGTLPNSFIQPEITETFEVGLEARFLNNRIGIDFTYYNSTTEDAIINVAVSRATGFNSRLANVAEVSNEGIEIVLDANPLQIGDFRWDIIANFTHNRNVTESLAEGVEEIGLSGFTSTSSSLIAGQPYGAIFGSAFQRNDNGQIVVGADGWPLQDPVNRAVGDPNPQFLLGLRNTFAWKGISVSVLLDIRQGGDVWCGTCGIINYFGTSQVTADQRGITDFVFEGVLEDGSPNTTPVDFANPADGLGAIKWVRYGFGGLSEESIFDASWVRLRELTVKYSLPASLFQNNFVKGIDVAFTGRNLWLSTDYPGIDPETNLTGTTNGFGLDYFNNPNTKSYGFSILATF